MPCSAIVAFGKMSIFCAETVELVDFVRLEYSYLAAYLCTCTSLRRKGTASPTHVMLAT